MNMTTMYDLEKIFYIIKWNLREPHQDTGIEPIVSLFEVD